MTTRVITKPVATTQPAPAGESISDELARLRAENEALKARQAQSQTLSIRIRGKGEKYRDSKGEEAIGKGTLSVYGLGRFPTSLYAGQWLRLLAISDDIKAAIEAHRDKLSFEKS